MIPALIAPLIANGLSLIGNAVLAKGKDYIEQKTGIKIEPDMSQENILKLRQYEMEHEEELLKLQIENNKLDFDSYKLEVEDRSSARDRDTRANESANASWIAKNITGFLAVAVLGLSFVLFYMVIYTSIPADKKDIVIYILGVLSGAVTQILSYFYGSSKSSANKDSTLAEAIRGIK